MIAITPYQLRRPSAARPGFGMQRRDARRSYRGVRQDAGHIIQPQCVDAAAQFRVAAISGVHQRHTERQAGCTARRDLLKRDLGLGPEADILRQVSRPDCGLRQTLLSQNSANFMWRTLDSPCNIPLWQRQPLNERHDGALPDLEPVDHSRQPIILRIDRRLQPEFIHAVA
jgi:hypothetical protein